MPAKIKKRMPKFVKFMPRILWRVFFTGHSVYIVVNCIRIRNHQCQHIEKVYNLALSSTKTLPVSCKTKIIQFSAKMS